MPACRARPGCTARTSEVQTAPCQKGCTPLLWCSQRCCLWQHANYAVQKSTERPVVRMAGNRSRPHRTLRLYISRWPPLLLLHSQLGSYLQGCKRFTTALQGTLTPHNTSARPRGAASTRQARASSRHSATTLQMQRCPPTSQARCRYLVPHWPHCTSASIQASIVMW